jgi:molybdate transport system substrate-binding protein
LPEREDMTISYRRIYLSFTATLVVSSIAVAGFAGCGSAGGGGSTLTVLAASSLTDAFGELARTFEEQNPGTEVRQSFESSSTLLTQIQQGAPADVFASAAREEMNTAVEDGLVAGNPRPSSGTARSSWCPKTTPLT